MGITTGHACSTSDPQWPSAPRDPVLDEDALHVWRIDLAAVSDEVLGSLSPAERRRAKRVLNPLKAYLWARSRGMLRALLGQYLRRDPSALRFSADSYGKPTLIGCRPRAMVGYSSAFEPRVRIHFNVSHSDGVALYAFTELGPVGVDVEVARRPVNESVAARVFGSAEVRRLQGLDAIARERQYLQNWTRHEATLKCHGTRTISPGLAPRRPMWIRDLDVGPCAAAAVAVTRQPSVVRCWSS